MLLFPTKQKWAEVYEIKFPFQFCSHLSQNSFGLMFISSKIMKAVCSVICVLMRLNTLSHSDQFFFSKTFCTSHINIIRWKQAQGEISSWVHLNLHALGHFQGSQQGNAAI